MITDLSFLAVLGDSIIEKLTLFWRLDWKYVWNRKPVGIVISTATCQVILWHLSLQILMLNYFGIFSSFLIFFVIIIFFLLMFSSLFIQHSTPCDILLKQKIPPTNQPTNNNKKKKPPQKTTKHQKSSTKKAQKLSTAVSLFVATPQLKMPFTSLTQFHMP